MSADNQISARQKHESYEHTQGHRQCYEECIHHAHEEHEYDQYKHETNYNGIYEVIERRACACALVTCNYNIKIFGKCCLLHLIHHTLYIIRCFNKILPSALDDVKRYHILAVEPCITVFFFYRI